MVLLSNKHTCTNHRMRCTNLSSPLRTPLSARNTTNRVQQSITNERTSFSTNEEFLSNTPAQVFVLFHLRNIVFNSRLRKARGSGTRAKNRSPAGVPWGEPSTYHTPRLQEARRGGGTWSRPASRRSSSSSLLCIRCGKIGVEGDNRQAPHGNTVLCNIP